MNFVWDEPKRRANLEKHGLDFADLKDGFSWDRFSVLDSGSSKTGRVRYRFVGKMFDEIIVVAVISPLGSEALSVISLRRAGMKERQTYAKNF